MTDERVEALEAELAVCTRLCDSKARAGSQDAAASLSLPLQGWLQHTWPWETAVQVGA